MPTLAQQVRGASLALTSGSDVELAEALVGLLGGRQNAVYDRGAVFVFEPSDNSWHEVPIEELHRAVAAFDGSPYTKPNLNLPSFLSVNRSKMTGSVRVLHDLLATPGFFDDAPLGAAFQQEFVRLDGNTVVVEPLDKQHRVCAEHVLPYCLLPESTAWDQVMPNFIKFISQVWAGCPDIQARAEFLGEYIGAAILRQTWRYKANPVFVGPKDTGKSVLLGVISALFPPGTVSNVPLQAMSERFRSMALVRAYANVVSELPAASLAESERAKAIFVGEPVQIEEKNLPVFTFRSRAAHFFGANEVPKTTDPALRGRMVLLTCTNVVPPAQQDRDLPEKLRAEVQAIASWAFWAAKRGVISRGYFERPPSSYEAETDWQTASDPVADWAHEAIEAAEGDGFVLTAELYPRYTAWCAAAGERPLPKNAFGRRLKAIGFIDANRRGRGFCVRFKAPPFA